MTNAEVDNNKHFPRGDLFRPDATIAITWFDGLANDSVAGSVRIDESDLRTEALRRQPVDHLPR
ncbi:hypothetical protein [Rothia uropygialis]|uniref:hypothetical protein n=1 Tax=Kocuria sp. 36 TaxID=1415402 RepID=UPI001EE8BCC5|nr:hypothetical protein [Kocuria sp. 36]